MITSFHQWLIVHSSQWGAYKLSLATQFGLSADALHIQVGMAFLCMAALMLRRSPMDWLPWAIVLGMELLNEGADLMLDGMGSTEATLAAGGHDVINTMFAPTLLLALGIWQRHSIAKN